MALALKLVPGEKKSVTPSEGLILNVTNAVLIPGKKSKGGGGDGSSAPYVVHARTTDGNGVPIDFPICILREKLTENATLGSTFPSDAPLEFQVHRGESSNNGTVHLSGYLQMDPTFDESDEEEDDEDYMPYGELEEGSQSDEIEGEEFDSMEDDEDGSRIPRLQPVDDEGSGDASDAESEDASGEEGGEDRVTELDDSEVSESEDEEEEEEEEVVSSKHHAKGKGGGPISGHKEMPAGAKRKLTNLASAAANANPDAKRHQTPKKQHQQTPTLKGVAPTPQSSGTGKKRNRNRGKKNKSN